MKTFILKTLLFLSLILCSQISNAQIYYYQVYNSQTIENTDSTCIRYKLANTAIEVNFDNDLITLYTNSGSIRYSMLGFGDPDDEDKIVEPNGKCIYICVYDEYLNSRKKITIKLNNTTNFGFILFEDKKNNQNIKYNVKLIE